MFNPLELVKEFHRKFHVPVLDKPSLIPDERSSFRYTLIKGEVDEYIEGVKNKDLENIAKELADIIWSAYGTVLEHGLQDKFEEIFKELYRSNMSKDYHEFKMVKGPKYFKADIKKILEN